MSRIVYVSLKSRSVSGGTKMIFRHVEALRELGYDARVWVRDKESIPTWFRFNSDIIVGEPFRTDDIIVLPEDGPNTLRQATRLSQRKIVFCQNPFYASLGIGQLSQTESGAYREFIACGTNVGNYIARNYPSSAVDVVNAFVDETIIHSSSRRRMMIACFPRKRHVEALYIEQGFRRRHPQHDDVGWPRIENLSEVEVAEVLSQSEIFLSRSRLEGLPRSTLEAMASGCICVGFTGIHGREYSTIENGLWVPEDDCDAAVEALAEVADMIVAQTPEVATMRQSALATAANYSRDVFLEALETCWSRKLAKPV